MRSIKLFKPNAIRVNAIRVNVICPKVICPNVIITDAMKQAARERNRCAALTALDTETDPAVRANLHLILKWTFSNTGKVSKVPKTTL